MVIQSETLLIYGTRNDPTSPEFGSFFNKVGMEGDDVSTAYGVLLIQYQLILCCEILSRPLLFVIQVVVR